MPGVQGSALERGQYRSIESAADNPRQTPPGVRPVSRPRVAAEVKAEA
jgi:hypothetical protein